MSGYTQTFNVKDRSSGFVPKNYTSDRHWKVDDYSFYLQDNWKLQCRLTVNLGVRYEYYSPVKERNGLVLLPQLSNNDVIGTLRSNAMLNFARDPGAALPPRPQQLRPQRRPGLGV